MVLQGIGSFLSRQACWLAGSFSHGMGIGLGRFGGRPPSVPLEREPEHTGTAFPFRVSPSQVRDVLTDPRTEGRNMGGLDDACLPPAGTKRRVRGEIGRHSPPRHTVGRFEDERGKERETPSHGRMYHL